MVDIHNGKYFFFYKSKLSNWHFRRFRLWDIDFAHGEQAMMASKAALFDDEDTFNDIINEYDPFKVQQLGRKIKNFNQAVWDSNKYNLVLEVSRARFSQIGYLKEILLATGGCYFNRSKSG